MRTVPLTLYVTPFTLTFIRVGSAPQQCSAVLLEPRRPVESPSPSDQDSASHLTPSLVKIFGCSGWNCTPPWLLRVCGHGCHNDDLSYQRVWPPFLLWFLCMLCTICIFRSWFVRSCHAIGFWSKALWEASSTTVCCAAETRWKILGQQNACWTFFLAALGFFFFCKKTLRCPSHIAVTSSILFFHLCFTIW